MGTLSIAVTLLTLLLSVYFIAKTKNEFTGIFFKVFAYLIFVAAIVLLAFQLFRGYRGGHYWHGKQNMHHYDSDHMNGNHHMGTFGDSDCEYHYDCDRNVSKKRIKKKLRKNRKNRELSGDSAEVFFESSTDTVDGKIIKKEIEIIKE